ncbi:HAD hydrolase-like protein [Chloroflexia bacterium SDU3-3]|nr:HAD hydrolase-like protein [Chloroflexia bacterium SDU3-3]
MIQPDALIFDLDGTLSDPAVGIARSVNYALAAHGFPAFDEATVSRYIGPPLDHMFRALTGEHAPETIASLVAKYRERYGQVGFAENTLYLGIPEALAALTRRGATLGLCTSKRVDFAEQILALFGLRDYFQFVSGGVIGVPKGQQLRALLAEGVVGPASTMIGDRDVDILAARANGLRSVGVLWGHGSREELEQAGADLILGSVEELVGLMDAKEKGAYL